MKIFNSLSEFDTSRKTVVTLGTFDGVHIGHKKIISRLTSTANDRNLESVILTFFPHPRMILGTGEVKLLNTIEEKALLLRQTGIDSLIIHPFDKDFSQLDAATFVKEILVERLNISKIIIGHDHRFGKNRSANIDDLIRFGREYQFEVEQIDAQEVDDITVSSTKIRNALTNGEVSVANEYLGYSYFFSGCVRKGKQLGRTIGYPTTNLVVHEEYKLIPAKGVYVVQIDLNGSRYYGMMNIGTKPTVEETDIVSVEVHIFDFSESIYDQILTVTVLDRLRDERRFDGLDQLKAQLASDKSASLRYISQLK